IWALGGRLGIPGERRRAAAAPEQCWCSLRRRQKRKAVGRNEQRRVRVPLLWPAVVGGDDDGRQPLPAVDPGNVNARAQAEVDGGGVEAESMGSSPQVQVI